MARWSDVIDIERKLRATEDERDVAMRDANEFCQYIRETNQIDTFLEWKAKRMGLHETLYGGSRVSELGQALAQAGDSVELQEAEQRGFERGRAFGQRARLAPMIE